MTKYLLICSNATQDEDNELSLYTKGIGFYDTVAEAREAAVNDLHRMVEEQATDTYDPETEEDDYNWYIEDYLSNMNVYNNLTEGDFFAGRLPFSNIVLEHCYASDYWQEINTYTIIKIA